jgi:hypothetical protein
MSRGRCGTVAASLSVDPRGSLFEGQNRAREGQSEPVTASVSQRTASSGLYGPYRNRMVIHGMQEVWVRIPIAPLQVRAIIRDPEPESSGARYSSKVPQQQRREVAYTNSDMAPPPIRLLAWPAAPRALRRGIAS